MHIIGNSTHKLSAWGATAGELVWYGVGEVTLYDPYHNHKSTSATEVEVHHLGIASSHAVTIRGNQWHNSTNTGMRLSLGNNYFRKLNIGTISLYGMKA